MDEKPPVVEAEKSAAVKAVPSVDRETPATAGWAKVRRQPDPAARPPSQAREIVLVEQPVPVAGLSPRIPNRERSHPREQEMLQPANRKQGAARQLKERRILVIGLARGGTRAGRQRAIQQPVGEGDRGVVRIELGPRAIRRGHITAGRQHRFARILPPESSATPRVSPGCRHFRPDETRG